MRLQTGIINQDRISHYIIHQSSPISHLLKGGGRQRTFKNQHHHENNYRNPYPYFIQFCNAGDTSTK
jgi:hypothetical protein